MALTCPSSGHLSRRRFLSLLGAGVLAPLLPMLQSGGPTDWDRETDLACSIREISGKLARQPRHGARLPRINGNYDQEFKIQIRADFLYPVASCFKAWIALYYYPIPHQTNGRIKRAHRFTATIVFSSNSESGTVLADVARRAPGTGNPIEKFNNFLWTTVGMSNGQYSRDWP